VARATTLHFHNAPTLGKHRSLWQRLRYPNSGLGPGLSSVFFSNAPAAFYYLPKSLRLYFVRTALGPSGGWFVKDKVIGRVPLLLGYTVERAEIQDGKVHLHLRSADGSRREIVTDHVIAATGYRVDMERLACLSSDIRAKIKCVEGAPVLSRTFESSVPGLYFAGLAAANSFGPVMRFAFGAGFAARRLTQSLVKSLARHPASARASSAKSVVDRAAD